MKKTGNQISDEGMSEQTASQFQFIRESLLLQKSEILNKNSEFKSSQAELEKSSDEVDNTTQELQNMVSIQLHERDRKILQLIDKALSKFSDDTYGICESCGDDVGIKRLQARPLASLCISCMEETEKSSRNMHSLQ